MRLSQRVRARLRDEFTHQKISQRVLARRLTIATGDVWTQSKVHKILTGQVQLLMDDFELLAREAGLTLVELTREPGREFVADLTPSELKLLAVARDAPDVVHLFLEMSTHLNKPRKAGRQTIRERMRNPEP